MVNFGLLALEIISLVWGTPANFNGFRVLPSLPVNLHVAKFRYEARAPESVYIVPVQQTAKQRAKFGWPAISDVAAVYR